MVFKNSSNSVISKSKVKDFIDYLIEEGKFLEKLRSDILFLSKSNIDISVKIVREERLVDNIDRQIRKTKELIKYFRRAL
ncbi:hypothetical protein J7J23_01745 [bacterium]|nr:hypothetical protein [bacterium]